MSPHERYTPQEVEPKNQDPRDYFQRTKLIKLAEELTMDDSVTHDWKDMHIVAVGTDDTRTFIGERYSSEGGLDIMYMHTNNTGSRILDFKNTPRDNGQIFVELARRNLSGFNPTSQEKTISSLATLDIEHMTEAEVLESVYRAILDSKEPMKEEQTMNSEDLSFIKKLSPEYRAQALKLLDIAKDKVSFSAIEEMTNKSFGYFEPETEDDQKYIVHSLAKNTIDIACGDYSNPGAQDLVPNNSIEKYYVKDLITHRFNSVEELQQVLESLPTEPSPDPRTYRAVSPEYAAMVPLDQVVGGMSISDISWTLKSHDTSRGVKKIHEMVQAFQDGSRPTNEYPIHYDKLGDKYFVSQDGRHRSAALKALGVPCVPALVRDLELRTK